jgi:hypothetical protein
MPVGEGGDEGAATTSGDGMDRVVHHRPFRRVYADDGCETTGNKLASMMSWCGGRAGGGAAADRLPHKKIT